MKPKNPEVPHDVFRQTKARGVLEEVLGLPKQRCGARGYHCHRLCAVPAGIQAGAELSSMVSSTVRDRPAAAYSLQTKRKPSCPLQGVPIAGFFLDLPCWKGFRDVLFKRGSSFRVGQTSDSPQPTSIEASTFHPSPILRNHRLRSSAVVVIIVAVTVVLIIIFIISMSFLHLQPHLVVECIVP